MKRAAALLLLFLTGCAEMQYKVKTNAGVVVPMNCIGRVVAASPKSFCSTLPEPSQMECTGKFRMEYSCWKVKAK